MNKSIFYYLFAVLLTTIISCKEDSSKPTEKPIISEIDPTNAYIGQHVTIIGSNFGYEDIKAKVVFSDSIEVSKGNCKKWNNSIIELNVPKGSISGDVVVIIATDTSNALEMIINPLPEFKMVLLPIGTFEMGSNKGDENEMPIHTVSVDGFYISKCEVTQLLWKSVMDTLNEEYYGDNYPVASLGWFEAVAFCNKLSELENLNPCYIYIEEQVNCDFDASGYRLPTEAEWEYACRSGTEGDFSGNGVISDIAWYADNSGFQRHPVGTKSANAFGLYDMHGNVWELCWDWFGADYYAQSPQYNPEGPQNGTISVIRGGSYIDGIVYLRSANRTFPHPDSVLCGLRIVRRE